MQDQNVHVFFENSSYDEGNEYPGRDDLADELGLDPRYLFPVVHDSQSYQVSETEWVYLPPTQERLTYRPGTPVNYPTQPTYGLSQCVPGVDSQKC